MKCKATSVALAFALSMPSFAADIKPFTIKDIRVEGVQRTDPGTVFNYLPLKVGELYDDEKATKSIKALFATGFFNDIRIETQDNVVIVSVVERPTIAEVSIDGAKVFSTKQITDALKANGFALGRIYDQSVLDGAIQELKKQYYARGLYSADIQVETTKLERNRVAIRIKIDEGYTAKIKKINIIGNQAFKENTLLEQFSSNESDWISWYTKSDQYSKQKVEADIEALRTFYLNHGYLDFEIRSVQVNLSDNKKDVFLTINLVEGQQYKISEIKLAGQLLQLDTVLNGLITLKPGEVYEHEKVLNSIIKMKDRLGDQGYAFAQINPVPEKNKEDHTVSLIFYIDPNRKVYVRRINIQGNKMTRDEVIRREMRQMESAPYSTAKLKRSEERIKQLGYFSDARVEMVPVGEAPDLVDVNVNVTEMPTGSINFAFSYGQAEGAGIMADVSQNNFLGTGNQFSLSFNTSKANRAYVASLVNPYATVDGVSMGWSLFQRRFKANTVELGHYHTDAYGGSFEVGIPITEYNRINFGFKAENLTIHPRDKAPHYITNFVKTYGERNWVYSLTSGWGHDTLDNPLYPTKGMVTSLEGEVATPPSRVKYYKLIAHNRMFFPLTKSVSLMWNVELGYGRSYGRNDKSLPFYRNFHAGGRDSVRGFTDGSLSPRDENGDAIGGNRQIIQNVELLFPFPGLKDNKAVRLAAFWDVGYAFGPNDKIKLSTLRQSVGVGVTWLSPIGRLRLTYGVPKLKAGDKKDSFQIAFGGQF